MKTITLAFVTSFLAISHAYSNCEYKFDATDEQIFEIGAEMGGVAINRFPLLKGSTVGFKLTDSNKTFMALSAKQAKVFKNLHINSTVIAGDHLLPATGITAFELNFKVPNILKEKGKLVSMPIMISGKSQDDKQTSIIIFYINNSDGTNTINTLAPVLQHDQSYIPLTNLNSALPVQNNLQGYQSMGFYLNQSTNQMGFIFNNKNYGYIGSLPSKLDNLYFMIPATYGDISTSDQNQDVSIELVTDRSKFKNTYPTGTKDICGN